MKAKKGNSEGISAFGSFIEISGNRQAVIEGCRGVLEFGDNRIVLSLGRLNVRVTGEGLTVTSFVYGQALIKGTIIGFDFCTAEGELE